MFKHSLIMGCVLGAAVPSALALDAFDRHSLNHLRQAAEAQSPLAELTLRDVAELDTLGRGITSPCIVVKTGEGNWTKALVSWGLRKSAEKPLAVLLIERYVTYDASRPGLATASGKDVMLFGGFAFDFDIGQVVPADVGSDVMFTEERILRAATGVELFALDGPAVAATERSETFDPTDHEGVLPQDFSGVWRVNADGRWHGVFDLAVDAKGNVDGQYVSDETQSSYNIVGRVDGATNRMFLEVELVNSPQGYEAFLWTTDKSTMAGTTTLSDRKFGFYAVREVQPAESATPTAE